MNHKPVFISTVSTQYKITANWRCNNAKRFPQDSRNADAEKRLLILDSQINISDEAWSRIAPLVQNDAVCLSALSETNRLVGFKEKPVDFEAWLERFCIILSRH